MRWRKYGAFAREAMIGPAPASSPRANAPLPHAHVMLMERVRTHDGRDAFASASDAVIPASLHGVGGVIGLQTVHVPHLFERVMKGKPGGGGSIIGYNPTPFPSQNSLVGTATHIVKTNGTGFAAPKRCQLPASAFHDVTSGGNGAESAAPGRDYCTGFGSIVVSQASSSP